MWVPARHFGFRSAPVKLFHQHDICYLMVEHQSAQPQAVVSALSHGVAMSIRPTHHKHQRHAIVTCSRYEPRDVLRGGVSAALIQQHHTLARCDGTQHLPAKF
jgi:hypothetical protein